MRYLSVCSGIEAATAAWHRLGWEPWAFSEIEKFPSAVLAHHYPDVPNLGDMTKFKEWPDEAIDLLVGGTPCQSFSVAGLRKGMDDPRGNLALVYLAVADRYRPQWLVWENVPGVLSSNKGRDFGAFLGALGKLGYGWSYRVLDAQYFGVAQRRRRVFVVGHLGDWRAAAAVLFERESLCGNPPPSREAGQEVTPTIRSGAPSGSRGHGARSGDSKDELIVPVAHALRGEGFDASEDGTGRGTPLVPTVMAHGQGGAEIAEDRCPSLTCNHEAPVLAFMENQRAEVRLSEQADSLKGGGGKPGQGYPAVLAFHNPQDPDVSGEITHPLGSMDNGMAVMVDEYNMTEGGNISITLSGMGSGNRRPAVRKGMSLRRLTPRECERLMGFSDDYTMIPWRNKPLEQCPDGPRYKALGNSMAVPVMRWIGERIALFESLEIS